MFPVESTATPAGLFNEACSAGPPSPESVKVPLPARVEIVKLWAHPNRGTRKIAVRMHFLYLLAFWIIAWWFSVSFNHGYFREISAEFVNSRAVRNPPPISRLG